MMRTRAIITIILLYPMLLMAGFVPQHVAEQVARNFFLSINQNTEPELQIVDNKSHHGFLPVDLKGSDVPPYYVFDMISSKGFIIISADDCVVPVLGYSLTSNYSGSDLPPALTKWLDDLSMQVNYVINLGEAPAEEIVRLWERYLSEGNKNGHKSEVDPLVTTTWNQSPYYNDLCPGGSVSGCVATAMTQIMKFWNYPAQGSGFHSYNHDNYGTLSVNFGATEYNWSQMPNNVTGPNNAVATLTYHAGVAVEMNYSPQSSGAYVISTHSPVEHCAEYALENYFNYDESTLQGVARENYTTDQWMSLIKGELNAGRPVLYAGFGSGGGHAFVCDGYDNFNYLHMNWGWGGYYDGYFPVDALDPSGTGTGGGSGGYNSGHQAVIGIQPPGGGGGGGTANLDMRLYDYVTFSTNPINYGEGFSIHTDIANYGQDEFFGDYCVAAFDEDGIFVEIVDIKEAWNLAGGNHYTNGITFSTVGMLSLLPGNYYMGIFYKHENDNWVLVNDGNYTNLVSLTVQYSNDIELYSDISVDGGTTITQYDGVSATVSLGNYGSWDFNGVFDISLYHMDGTLAETIATTESLTLSAGYYNTYTFTLPSVTSAPGTYLMAVLLQESGGSWELKGSTYYTNPIKVVIKEAEIPGDNYEDNDTQENAYLFSPSFSGNNAMITTPGANSHNGSDADFYKIHLDPGYDYTITCRAHDSYNSGNGQQYSNDVLWTYTTGDEWSEVFDDICNDQIILQNGGTFYFLVAPYFEGETGTYLMDIQITRELTGITEAEIPGIIVHPNPASSTIYLATEREVQYSQYEIMDLTGKTIPVPQTNPFETGIDINNLAPGMYILKIETDKGFYTTKFLKQ
jgi:hypothetical protein